VPQVKIIINAKFHPICKEICIFLEKSENLLSPMAYIPRTITPSSPLKFFAAFKKLLAPEKIEV
jgi:hypothetical protein